MADITICTNYSCPQRQICYRYIAVPDAQYQPYYTFVWNGSCKDMIPLWSEYDTTHIDRRNQQ